MYMWWRHLERNPHIQTKESNQEVSMYRIKKNWSIVRKKERERSRVTWVKLKNKMNGKDADLWLNESVQGHLKWSESGRQTTIGWQSNWIKPETGTAKTVFVRKTTPSDTLSLYRCHRDSFDDNYDADNVDDDDDDANDANCVCIMMFNLKNKPQRLEKMSSRNHVRL